MAETQVSRLPQIIFINFTLSIDTRLVQIDDYRNMAPPKGLLPLKNKSISSQSAKSGRSAPRSSMSIAKADATSRQLPEVEGTSCDSSESGWSASWAGSASSDRQSNSSGVTVAGPLWQRFAPGLAPRKQKIDPYDPLGLMAPKDDYTLMKEKEDAELRGAWTTMDPFTQKVNYDRNWHTERRPKTQSNYSVRDSLSKKLPPGMPDTAPTGASGSTDTGENEDLRHSGRTPSFNDRFENADLDIDPEIRAKFKGIDSVLNERMAPLSEFQRRNKGIIAAKAAPSALKVIIGDKVVKTVEQKVDNRGQFQDRHGNYLGKDMGRMKKHLVEDRAALIKLRDDQMVRATQEKRKWEAMAPEERQEILAKRRAQAEAFRMGPGAAESDIFEYSETPAEYLRQSSAWSNASRSARGRSSSASIASSDTVLPNASIRSRPSTLSSVPRGDAGTARSSVQTTNASDSSSRRHHHAIPPPPGFRTPTTNDVSASETSSQADSSTLFIDPGPELFPIEDVSVKVRPSDDEKLARQYDDIRLLSVTRGRVVTVTLHEPAKFSPANIVTNLFAGIIQEIQFYPRERQAIVIFVFPTEAEAFVKHVSTVKERDGNTHRRLQLDAEWYGGSEDRAIYPVQPRIYVEVLANEARRVLKLSGVKATKRKKDVAEDMKVLLGKILVKVALIVEKRRYVREEEGNAAIVEFASIKDAVEAMVKFKKGRIAGYEGSQASWLSDPCDKPNKYGQFDGCWCRNCKDV